ncbi:unnamed protein product [Polarella glacialis]|uniref:Uncharacterized protein n=1 Tax=Polarella glacialis TaxID=89957 RepID=A0A813EP56_POLGL|nr:unnamed protein product [Polarella glacialis]CAE8732322.1 unnamed protein product [Polarella glacialis]
MTAAPAPPAPEKEPEFSWTSPSTWTVGWVAILIPNIAMLVNHQRGGSTVIINAVVNSPLGVRGLFLMPPFFVFWEKAFYDTSLCLRGMDPNAEPGDKHGGDFPSTRMDQGALPSLSLVAVREKPLVPRDLVPSALLALFGEE